MNTYVPTCLDTYRYLHTPHMYLHTHIPTYIYIPTYLHTHIPTYIPTYIHTYLPAYVPTYQHACMHT